MACRKKHKNGLDKTYEDMCKAVKERYLLLHPAKIVFTRDQDVTMGISPLGEGSAAEPAPPTAAAGEKVRARERETLINVGDAAARDTIRGLVRQNMGRRARYLATVVTAKGITSRHAQPPIRHSKGTREAERAKGAQKGKQEEAMVVPDMEAAGNMAVARAARAAKEGK